MANPTDVPSQAHALAEAPTGPLPDALRERCERICQPLAGIVVSHPWMIGAYDAVWNGVVALAYDLAALDAPEPTLERETREVQRQAFGIVYRRGFATPILRLWVTEKREDAEREANLSGEGEVVPVTVLARLAAGKEDK